METVAVSSPRIRTIAFLAIAAIAAAIFFAVATDFNIYAPGAYAMHHRLGHYFSGLRDVSPGRVRHYENMAFFLRKTYSVIAFAIVGFLAAPAIPRGRRILIDAILVGAFSTIIEIAQKVLRSPESIWSNLFDIGCGALGGIIGALAWHAAVAIVLRFERKAK